MNSFKAVACALLFTACASTTKPEAPRSLPENYLACKERRDGLEKVYVCWNRSFPPKNTYLLD